MELIIITIETQINPAIMMFNKRSTDRAIKSMVENTYFLAARLAQSVQVVILEMLLVVEQWLAAEQWLVVEMVFMEEK